MAEPLLELRGIRLTRGAHFRLQVDLSLPAGAHAALVGPSGSGKTTLLRIIAGLQPAQGEVRVNGRPIGDAAWRARTLGFAFQDFALIDYLNVRENILLPLRIGGRRPDDAARHRLEGLLARAGLTACAQRLPKRLSHGERQRIAVCRALIHTPRLILADEPTASLDPTTAARTLELLRDEARRAEAGLLLVTHDPARLEGFDPVLSMQDFRP